MISAVSLRSMLVKAFRCICLLGLFLLPAAAVTTQVSRRWCKPSSSCTHGNGCPPEPPHVLAIPQTGIPPVTAATWPCCACHAGRLGLQRCDDQMEKTRPPAFSTGTWAGEGDNHMPVAWQGPEDHANFHSGIAPAPVPTKAGTPLNPCHAGPPALAEPRAGLVHPPSPWPH